MADMNVSGRTSQEQTLGDQKASGVEHQTPDQCAANRSVSISSPGRSQPKTPQCAPGNCCSATGHGRDIDGTDLSMTAVDKVYRAAASECRQDYENLLLKLEIPTLAESDGDGLLNDDDDLTDAEACSNNVHSGHDGIHVGREPDRCEDSTETGSVEPGDEPLRYYSNYTRRH